MAKDLTPYFAHPIEATAYAHPPIRWKAGEPKLSRAWDASRYGMAEGETPPKPPTWDRMTIKQKLNFVQMKQQGRGRTAAKVLVDSAIKQILDGQGLSQTTAGLDLIEYNRRVTQQSKEGFLDNLRQLAKTYPLELTNGANGLTLEVFFQPVSIPFGKDTLTFGPFVASIPIQHPRVREVWFTPCHNTPTYETISPERKRHLIHPHMISSGRSNPCISNLCFGDEQGMADLAMKNNDMFSLVNSIEQVLKTYNPGSPYNRPENYSPGPMNADRPQIICPACETAVQRRQGAINTCRCVTRNSRTLHANMPEKAWVLKAATEELDGFDWLTKPTKEKAEAVTIETIQIQGLDIAIPSNTIAGDFLARDQTEAAKIAFAQYCMARIRTHQDQSFQDAILQVAKLQRELGLPREEWITSTQEYEPDEQYGEYRMSTYIYRGNQSSSPHPDTEEDDEWAEHEDELKTMFVEASTYIENIFAKEGLVAPEPKVPIEKKATTGDLITEEQLLETLYPNESRRTFTHQEEPAASAPETEVPQAPAPRIPTQDDIDSMLERLEITTSPV